MAIPPYSTDYGYYNGTDQYTANLYAQFASAK